MKAIVCPRYGSPDVLRLEEVAKPTPGDDEVLVAVQAAAVAAGDWHLLRGEPFLVRLMFGLFKPKRGLLGSDVAGRVEAVGRDVQGFKPGDEVFGDLSGSGFGAFAEYVCAPEKALAPRPEGLTFEEAAAVPVSAVTALQALRDEGQLQAGQQVLVNGASGGVGTYAVQIAKAFGADVTGTCSTSKLDLVREIGADHVVDYTKQDVTQSGRQYDLILDAAAYRSLADYKRVLRPGGVYVLVGGATARLFQAMLLGPLMSKKGERKMGGLMAKPNQEDLLVMKDLLEEGQVKPVIDRRFPLSETADAIRYLEAGKARGKVVITVP